MPGLSLSLGLGLSPRSNGPVGFTPASLFASSQPGFYSEAITPSRVWQDTARTTPAAVGDPVGSWELKTASSTIYATQATTASKPILRQNGARYYLEFDGVDDRLDTPSINFTTTDAVTLIAGIRKTSDAGAATVIEGVIAAGSFALYAPHTAGATYYGHSRGSLFSAIGSTNAAHAAPQTAIITVQGRISTDTLLLRKNSVQIATAPDDQGTGNYADQVITIGRRANNTQPFSGHIYGLLVRGAQTTGTPLTDAETHMNTLTGAY